MVKKQNLILLRGKEISFVNLNVWTTSINGGIVALHWKLPQAPCSLPSTLAAMSQSYQISPHVPGPSSLHPGRGLGSQKAQWFLQRDCDIYSQLGRPLQILGVICPFGARDVRVPGKPWVTGHYGCQSRGSQWHVRCSGNWNHLAVQHLSGVAFSHWSYPNPLPLQNCRFYVVERILVLLFQPQ